MCLGRFVVEGAHDQPARRSDQLLKSGHGLDVAIGAYGSGHDIRPEDGKRQKRDKHDQVEQSIEGEPVHKNNPPDRRALQGVIRGKVSIAGENFFNIASHVRGWDVAVAAETVGPRKERRHGACRRRNEKLLIPALFKIGFIRVFWARFY
jgi:hypothetical protein